MVGDSNNSNKTGVNKASGVVVTTQVTQDRITTKEALVEAVIIIITTGNRYCAGHRHMLYCVVNCFYIVHNGVEFYNHVIIHFINSHYHYHFVIKSSFLF